MTTFDRKQVLDTASIYIKQHTNVDDKLLRNEELEAAIRNPMF
jgi:hypothetical protein